VERIIQREINRFVMETFGRSLESKILEAIRQELNPTFQEGDLSSVYQIHAYGFGVSRRPEAGLSRETGSPASRFHFFHSGHSGTGLTCPGEAPEGQDLMERLIRIIMEATGFNREEIQPDMDLRRDLSIRSSASPSSWMLRNANSGSRSNWRIL